MSGWVKQPIGDLPLYQARVIAGLPRMMQGFTTRDGGVSQPPYDTLNLGGHVGDAPADVQANRQRLWADLGFTEAQVALAEQVHGDNIAVVTTGTGSAPIAGADALVTDTPGMLLMLLFADCVPVYSGGPAAESRRPCPCRMARRGSEHRRQNSANAVGRVWQPPGNVPGRHRPLHRRRQLRSRPRSRGPVPQPVGRAGGQCCDAAKRDRRNV